MCCAVDPSLPWCCMAVGSRQYSQGIPEIAFWGNLLVQHNLHFYHSNVAAAVRIDVEKSVVVPVGGRHSKVNTINSDENPIAVLIPHKTFNGLPFLYTVN